MNPETTPGIDIENRGFRPADGLTDRLFDLVRDLQVARDKFDEEQLVEAIKQALESGDFVKYIVAEPGPPPEAWNGMLRQMGMEPSGKYKFTTRSMVSYEPGREAARLREKIENAGRLIWTEVEDEGGGFWAQTPFFLYSVRPDRESDGWVAFLTGQDGRGHATADGAKAMCEADWRRRVSALLGGTL